jgi:hypothetical protein
LTLQIFACNFIEIYPHLKTLFMKKTIFYTTLITVFCFVAVLMSCSKSDTVNLDDLDVKCGDSRDWQLEFPELVNSSIETGNIREFIIEDKYPPTNMCTEEHVSVRYQFSCQTHDPVPGLKVFGKAYWGIYKPQMTELKWEPPTTSTGWGQYYVTTTVGLKEAFPSKPGNIYVQLVIQFPSKGSEAADIAYRDSIEAHKMIYVDYKEYKQPL